MKAINHILIAAALLALAGCSKWTEQEPVQVLYPTLKDKNPELYARYLASVRDYRASEHQVLIAKFDNKQGAPAGRADHIDCLPDSVDYVILNHPDNLSGSILSEMQGIREEKAILTLMEISYDALAREWQDLLAAEAEAAPEAEVSDDTDRFTAFVGEKVREALAVADKYAYDGVNAVFTGKNPASFREEQQADARRRQDAFFQPVVQWAGNDRLLFFEGNPKNVLGDSGILSLARYIILPCETAQNEAAFNAAVADVLVEGVPADRFVVGVTAIDVTDEANTAGTFSGGISAIVGAARWAVAPAGGFSKKGICVNHAQFDYFNIQDVYGQIGAAISIMNPSPVK